MSKAFERRRPIISIMGDRFMLPSMFEKAIREKCGETPEIRSYEMPWPDEPMEHGYAELGMEGLKEYQGTADEVMAHMDGAEIAVTHLAPFSARVIERLPELKLIAVSRGGPVNIDMAAARERKISRRQHARPECVRRRRVRYRRHSCRDPAHHKRARKPASRRVAGRSLSR